MTELFVFIIVMGLTGIPSWLIAIVLINWRPDWARKRILASASLPLPLSMWTLTGFGVVSAIITPPEKCGVDECAMALASALYVALLGVVMLVMGLIGAAFAYRAYGPHEEHGG